MKKPYTRVSKGDLKGALAEIKSYQNKGEEYSLKQITRKYHIGAVKRTLIPDMRNIEITDEFAKQVQATITQHVRNCSSKKEQTEDSTDKETLNAINGFRKVINWISAIGIKELTIKF